MLTSLQQIHLNRIQTSTQNPSARCKSELQPIKSTGVSGYFALFFFLIKLSSTQLNYN